MGLKSTLNNGHASIKDIARAAGVSHTAVSRALRDKKDIGEDTKARIRQIAEKLNYQPHETARHLVLGKTSTIGLLVYSLTNPMHGDMVQYIAAEAEKLGYSILLSMVQSPLSEQDAQLLQRRKVDGLILPSFVSLDKIGIAKLNKSRLPSVFYDNIAPMTNAVTVDRDQGVYQAVKYLADLGHRDFAHLCFNPKDISIPTKLRGFRRAITEKGLKIRDEWMIEGIGTLDSGYDLTEKLLRQKNLPTAIFYHNDLSAIGGMAALSAHKIGIPDDVSVVGFDNIEMGQYTVPALTTIEKPVKEMAKRIVRLLLEVMENPGKKHQQVTLAQKLIVRKSTGPAKKEKRRRR